MHGFASSVSVTLHNSNATAPVPEQNRAQPLKALPVTCNHAERSCKGAGGQRAGKAAASRDWETGDCRLEALHKVCAETMRAECRVGARIWHRGPGRRYIYPVYGRSEGRRFLVMGLMEVVMLFWFQLDGRAHLRVHHRRGHDAIPSVTYACCIHPSRLAVIVVSAGRQPSGSQSGDGRCTALIWNRRPALRKNAGFKHNKEDTMQ
ncbi:hypothetical protein J3F83DRAFT_366766 [Trichoderma novae-zelandiae]